MSDDVDVLVCGLASRPHFPEALHTQCADCGVEVVFMPHAPVPVKRVCMDCAATLMQVQMAAGEPVEMSVTRQSVLDLVRWRAIRERE